ncbi:MAG: low molecular weight phosphotyrosine protein phosphatase [Trueperaceae bacterium]|nr:low molecular weight phosphotyrosine protein phosphatase [Trueperaceae bacterium]
MTEDAGSGRSISDDASARPLRVLFVCTGNICRSPTAEGVFRKLVNESGLAGRVEVDSAGTHGYHEGEPPTSQAVITAAQHGYDLSGLRARRLEPSDCTGFDRILVMDRGHLNRVTERCAGAGAAKVRLFMEHAPSRPEREVPDPYGKAARDYEYVLGLIEAAARGLLDDVRRELGA